MRSSCRPRRGVFSAADPPVAKRLARCFAQLEREPRRHNAIRMLSGPLAGMRRYRVGDWRVVFMIDDERSQVSVLAIAHRREVYE